MKYDYTDIFVWDGYSDQPYPIKNRAFKKEKRKENLFDIIKLLLTNIILFPIFVVLMFFYKKYKTTSNNQKIDIFGMGVNLDKEDKSKEINQLLLINELKIKKVLIRVYLSDINNLDRYKEFVDSFVNDKKEVMINIIQDRVNIEDKKLLKKNLIKIFTLFDNINLFQIGSTINRTKWGFFSIKEYLEFFLVAQNVVKNISRPNIKLIAPSIIDFEYYFTIRALYNFIDVRFDALSALLYVDRRGAPENTQYKIFDTTNKIRLLKAIVDFSPKVKNKDEIYITEANWPISNTAPYAPTSELECVSIEDYCAYMVRYYILAIATGNIKTIYWHQLIAKGYGLYNQEQNIKYDSFEVYKTMVAILDGAKFLKIEVENDIFKVYFRNNKKNILVCWQNNNFKTEIKAKYDKILSIFNKTLSKLEVSKLPIYIIKIR